MADAKREAFEKFTLVPSESRTKLLIWGSSRDGSELRKDASEVTLVERTSIRWMQTQPLPGSPLLSNAEGVKYR